LEKRADVIRVEPELQLRAFCGQHVTRKRNGGLPVERILKGECELAVAHFCISHHPDGNTMVVRLPFKGVAGAGFVVDRKAHFAHRACDGQIDVPGMIPVAVLKAQFRLRCYRERAGARR
jgi:hypothetical protein